MGKNVKTGSRTMPFTEEQMKQVFETNLIDFAIRHGFEIEKGDRNTVHVKHSGGLYLFRHGRGYYQFTGEKRGNIIQFAQEYLGAADFKSAVEMILGCRAYEQAEHCIRPVEKKPRGELILPPRDRDSRKIVTYLTDIRGIDREIVHTMMEQKKVYQAITQRGGYTFRNCAFVGYDRGDRPRYCALRTPDCNGKFRQDVENSDKTYGFCMEGRSNRVYEFESPIDAMSHATLCSLYGMDWKKDHRVSEGCLSDRALSRYLKLHPEIKEIVFCYDNDMNGKDARGQPRNHGQIQADVSAAAFAKAGYRVFIQTPRTKDFNEDLLTFRQIRRNSQTDSERTEEDMGEIGF